MWTQFCIDGNMPTQYVVSTARDWAVRCTVAEGYNEFHMRFSEFTEEIFDCDCNVQLSTMIRYFSFQTRNRYFQRPTTFLTFNWRFSLSTLNGDSNCQLWLKFSTVIAIFNCDCNVQLRSQRSTAIAIFNCNYNVQLRLQRLTAVSTFNCDYNFKPQLQLAIQLSTVIQLFNGQLRFQFLNVIRLFNILTTIPTFNRDLQFQHPWFQLL